MANLRRIEVLKMSFFLGLFGFFFGIVIGLLQGVLWSLSFPMLNDLFIRGFIIPFFGIAITLILHPVFYGIVFFLSGLIFTPLVNLALKLLGGIIFEFGSSQLIKEKPFFNLKK